MSDSNPDNTPNLGDLQPPPLPTMGASHAGTPQPPPLPPPIPAAPTPRNTLGIVGLTLVIIAAVLTPTGICLLPIIVLIPLGLLGAFLGLISLYKSPRWPGLVAILLFVVCAVIWIATTVGVIAVGSRLGKHIQDEINQELDRTKERMDRGDSVPARPVPSADNIGAFSAAATALSSAAEAQRNPDGSAANFVNLSESVGVASRHQSDPWGMPYRYTRDDSPRGYTFISDGPDKVSGTQDDIDILDLPASVKRRDKK